MIDDDPAGRRATLLLLRHAKSSRDDPGLADHDRPLAPRGEQALIALRRHITDTGIVPDLVLCSTARRAVDTWKGVAGAYPPDTPIEFRAELYGGNTELLLEQARRTSDTVGCVLLVGHNPSLGDLAVRLVGSGDAELLGRLRAKVPSGAFATLVTPLPWSKLRWGVAELIDYVVPRDLRTPR